MSEEVILKVGLTPRHPCSYLGHEQEQLLVLMDHELLNAAGYERLLTAGFRRSGNDIYRPHCPACSACQSLRIHSERFTPSRGQKRIRQLNRDLELVLSYDDKPEYYQLYERYIRERHRAMTSEHSLAIFHVGRTKVLREGLADVCEGFTVSQ